MFVNKTQSRRQKTDRAMYKAYYTIVGFDLTINPAKFRAVETKTPRMETDRYKGIYQHLFKLILFVC